MIRTQPHIIFSLLIACALLAGCGEDSKVTSQDASNTSDVSVSDDTTQGTLTSRDTSEPDAAKEDASKEDAIEDVSKEDTREDAADVTPPPPSDAALLAAQWIAQDPDDAESFRRVGLSVTGLTAAELTGVEVGVSGVSAISKASFEATATAADLTYVERFAFGARWTMPIQGDATLDLVDEAGNVLATLAGQANPDHSVTLRGKGTGTATIYDITIRPHARLETEWTQGGQVPIAPPLAPTASFSVAYGVDAEGAAPSGLDAATRWVLTVNEETPCAARGCVPVPSPVRYSGDLNAERIAHFEAAVPADFVAPDGEFVEVDVEITPPAAKPNVFGVVLAINNTKKAPPPPSITSLKPSATDLSGVPQWGMASMEMFLLQGPSAGPSGRTDEILQFGDRLVLVSTDWAALDATPQEATTEPDAYAKLGTGPGSAFAFWPDIPVHSFQVGADLLPEFTGNPEGFRYLLTVDGDGDPLTRSVELTAGDAQPACYRDATASVGYCAQIYPDGLRWRVALTAWTEHHAQLPTTDVLHITPTTGAGIEALGPAISSDSVAVSYHRDVKATFAIEVCGRNDLLNQSFMGEVSVFAGTDTNGSARKVGQGTYDAAFVMGETNVIMSPGRRGGGSSARFDALIGGDPIPFATSDSDRLTTQPLPPAVVMHVSSNGSGTRQVATANTGKPGLL